MIDVELFLELAKVFPEALNSELGKKILTTAQTMEFPDALEYIRGFKKK